MTGQQRWRFNDGWRGTLSKAFPVAVVTAMFGLASWWTGYVWAKIQDHEARIPANEQVTTWQAHVATDYPALRQQVAVLEAQQLERDKRDADILARLIEIEHLLRRGQR